VRGALQPLAGVRSVDVQPGNRDFSVAFDPAQVTVDALLAALRTAKEPAARR
jgi:allophanate hydrolase subunit 1